MSTEATSDLLRRIQGATEGSRELDRAIHEALVGPTKDPHFIGVNFLVQITSDGRGWNRGPDYSSSIDAAIGLVERVLPGCVWTKTFDNHVYLSMRPEPFKAHQHVGSGWHHYTPLAIIEALLSAVLAQSTPAQADNPTEIT